MTPRNSGRFSGAGVASALPIRVGVSRCLLGEEVRFDGGHKRDRFLTDVLGRHVEWVPVCPEVEAGFGTPREAMRLLGDAEHPKLITMTSKRDMTTPLAVYSKRKLEMLEQTELSGYIFKKDSPKVASAYSAYFLNRCRMPAIWLISSSRPCVMYLFPSR